MRDDLRFDWELYEQHADEAAFLWNRWEGDLMDLDTVLDDVAESEERLLAHVDALVLGGAAVVERFLVPALGAEEAERVASAVYVLLSPELAGGAELVRVALAEAALPLRPAFQRALEVREREALPAWVPLLLKQGEPAVLALALEVMASHGMDPGAALPELLRHPDPRVATAALRAAMAINHPLERQLLQSLLESCMPTVRDAAIEAGLLGGSRAAWHACKAAVEARAPQLRLPALLLALGGKAPDVERLNGLLSVPPHRLDALWALGFAGSPAAAEACLEWMGDPTTAPLAGEAFGAITGLRLQGQFVTERPEQEVLPPLEEENLDADLVPEHEDALPFPAAEQVAAWWKEARRGFGVDQRYLDGKPFGPEALLQALRSGPMRRRHALALDLKLRSHGTLVVPTRALTARQLTGLGVAQSASPAAFRPWLGWLRS